MSEQEFEFLEGSKDTIQWVCTKCVTGQTEKKGKLEAQLDELTKLVRSMAVKIQNLEGGHTGDSLDQKIEKMVERKLAEAFDEKVEREKRMLNLIVVNLDESRETEPEERKRDEMERVKALVTKVCPEFERETIEDPVRLGRAGGRKPRMLRVKVSSEGVRQQIVRNMHKLNEGVGKEDRVYINPDYTPIERERNKELRAQLQQRIKEGERNIGIRKGKIVQVKWAPRPGRGNHEESEGEAH